MESDAEPRAELEAAIAKVSRQIEIEETSSNLVPIGPSGRPALIAGLRAELSDLEGTLAGLAPGPPAEADGPADQPTDDLPPQTPVTQGRGVLIALRGSSAGKLPGFDPVVLGVLLLSLGAIGAVLSAAVALAHFVFGAPLYEDRWAHRPMTDPDALGALAAILVASSFIAGVGVAILRVARRGDTPTDLVR
jgi:hypothetical protein